MAKQLPEGSFKILNGPSKFDLMCSLFDGKIVKITCDIRIGSSVTMKISPVLEVKFGLVGAEDGSHDSWCGKVWFHDPNYETEFRQFYYDSRTRTGTIHAKGQIVHT